MERNSPARCKHPLDIYLTIEVPDIVVPIGQASYNSTILLGLEYLACDDEFRGGEGP
jgi:hypothetical protein